MKRLEWTQWKVKEKKKERSIKILDWMSVIEG